MTDKRRKHQASSVVEAFDAKTHLGQLLHRAARGEVITITRSGVPVARLGPVGRAHQSRTPDELRSAFLGLQRTHRLEGLTTRDLINEGRRT